ncbi:hypothetical protein M9H77_03757 [Catharanthus roseus]|uniref:Uncharacterized protein n=1 Tax=Catharanthus roseus TaxID=4058 RepID=A0ACC0CCK6_CATRO|nr:hypothetical protein M9H77_03757 [Catharanthus roseus]
MSRRLLFTAIRKQISKWKDLPCINYNICTHQGRALPLALGFYPKLAKNLRDLLRAVGLAYRPLYASTGSLFLAYGPTVCRSVALPSAIAIGRQELAYPKLARAMSNCYMDGDYAGNAYGGSHHRTGHFT